MPFGNKVEYIVETRERHRVKYPRSQKMPWVIQAIPSGHHRVQVVRTSSGHSHHHHDNKATEEVKNELKKVQSKLAEKEKEEMLRAVRAEEFQKGEKSGLAKAEKKVEDDRKMKALIKEELVKIVGGGSGMGLGRALPPGYPDDDGGYGFPVLAGHNSGGDGGRGGPGSPAFALPPPPPSPRHRQAHLYHSHAHNHAFNQNPFGVHSRPETAFEIFDETDPGDKLRISMKKPDKGPGPASQPLLTHLEPDAEFLNKFRDLSRGTIEEIWNRIHGDDSGGATVVEV